ncbi:MULTISPECIES: sigma-70 family RNA polymerase sigma factor [Thalassospira]|uniref:RNA polymerase subunit sigma24 n=2 Tax=Thalassospira TaxID=168934 RepID=A0A367VZL2_9PROT|nr:MULTISPECIES: sigma-70 family RNA polymerase sigma factor [Thalassospira]MDG4720321.1 sigma-70 family RNA polymerase sigma factor [Thalassospira sp. FZY0004]RCK32185.1 RNA polymerase subunit sigma24 [Thalassospira profundimaris]
MTTTRDLENLLRQSAEGDMDAFERLYHATSAKLFGIVLRILKNRAQSEDALQDIYVRVWQNAGDFEPGRSSIITWMATIARNRAIDIVRRRKPETDMDDREVEALVSSNNIFDEVALASDMRALDHCMGGLEEDRRKMIRLAYLEGWSRAELADLFAQPVGTIKTWLHRSLRQLKECLGS